MNESRISSDTMTPIRTFVLRIRFVRLAPNQILQCPFVLRVGSTTKKWLERNNFPFVTIHYSWATSEVWSALWLFCVVSISSFSFVWCIFDSSNSNNTYVLWVICKMTLEMVPMEVLEVMDFVVDLGCGFHYHHFRIANDEQLIWIESRELQPKEAPIRLDWLGKPRFLSFSLIFLYLPFRGLK